MMMIIITSHGFTFCHYSLVSSSLPYPHFLFLPPQPLDPPLYKSFKIHMERFAHQDSVVKEISQAISLENHTIAFFRQEENHYDYR